MPVRPHLVALAAALAASAPAAAQSGAPGDIVGAWSFETRPYNGAGRCVMSGVMRVYPAKSGDAYPCELTAVEECDILGRSVVVQSCTATRSGTNQLSVRSNIEDMLEIKTDPANYVPDNFALTIKSADRMFGSLVSAAIAPVEFRRTVDGVS